MKEPIYNFPSSLAPAEEKKTKEYGLAYAQAVWARYNADVLTYSTQKSRWILNRKYAEGMQSVEKYKDRMDIQDTSWLNLDFSPIAIIPKFVDNIVGKLINQTYKIQCNPLDVQSRTKEDEYRGKLYANMLLKNVNDEMAPKTGVSLIDKSVPVPEDDEEIDIYMQMNYKSAEAMAMELAIQYVMDYNDFKTIEEKIIRDLVNLKIAATKTYYNKDKKIIQDYVDPVDLIIPYTKDDEFKNIPYVGIMKKYTIQQISEMTDEFTETQLWDIAKQYAGANFGNRAWVFGMSYDGYYRTNTSITGRQYDDFMISVLEFEYLGIDYLKYEKKDNKYGGSYFQKKSSTYEAPKESKYNREVIGKRVTNRYEGKWVVGSKLVFDYKKANNIPREKADGQYSTDAKLSVKIIAPGIYDMQNKSLTERIIPHGDQLQLIQLKTQQLIAKAIPPGIFVDSDAISNISNGVGQGTMKPTDVVKMFQQTGSLIGRHKDDEGKPINGKPVEILSNGISPDIDKLDRLYHSELQKIYDVIGYNQATDGSAPPADALVGVQKLSIQSTNNSLRPLNNAYVKLVSMTAKELSIMIQDKFEYAGGLEGFERSIGTESIKTIKEANGLEQCEFGIKIEFLPDELERAQVDQMITVALQNKQIDIDDVILIRRQLTQNVKLAEQMLIYRKKKHDKDEMSKIQQQTEMNSQQQQQSAAVTGQIQQQTLQLEAQTEAQRLQLEYQLKGQLSAQEHQQKMHEIALTNSGKIQVADSVNATKVDVVKHSHDAKLAHTAFESAITPQKTARTEP